MIQRIIFHLFLFATVHLAVAISHAQESPLRQLQSQVEAKDLSRARETLNAINPDKLSRADKALFMFLSANIAVLENRDNLAIDYYIRARNHYISLDSLDRAAGIDLDIVSLLIAHEKQAGDYQPYLDRYLAYANKKKDRGYKSRAFMELGKSFYDKDPAAALNMFKKALTESAGSTDVVYKAKIYQNIGATYATDDIMKPDSAIYMYNKALSLLSEKVHTDRLFYLYTNKGVAYTKMKYYDSAINAFIKADSLSNKLKEYKAKNKEALYGFMANTYKESGDYKKALEYVEKQEVYRRILNETEQRKAIREIDTKYKTEEKEAENKNLKHSIRKSRMLALSALGFIIVLLTISILGYKNITKKKKIAQQEKLIETQKLEKILKEQELHEIDLMLESQEKERQLIANELHDNLGSILATLKMNFEHLKNQKANNQSEDFKRLYEKTDILIADAYQEVRNISHLKNLGVKGDQGLLMSVKKMAEKMSIPQKLQINVIAFGLDRRIENSLEVTLFRMIQELCTNIIKHSGASEVSIYITLQSDNEMNIMIEDNGCGFSKKAIEKKEGIGLKSIEKKTEQLGGSFTIDSQEGKGTTIIIDIPV